MIFNTASTRWTLPLRAANLGLPCRAANEDPLANADRPAMPIPSKDLWTNVSRVLYPSRRWILVVVGALVAAVVILVAQFFPFTEKNVSQSLRETFPSQLTIDRFETAYFPHPGCRAEGVRFRSVSSPPGSPALVTIQKLTIQGRYADFLWRPHHIAKVYLDGLRVQIPHLGNAGAFRGGYTNSRMTIGEVVADGAIVEFARAGGKPATRFDIHELRLQTVSAKAGMSYQVFLQNPMPPGEIRAAGHFGPFNASDPNQTPASGAYSLDHADLSVFRGVEGIVKSHGTFSGALSQLHVEGASDSPDFEVVRSGHAAPLSTRFQLTVNGTNGDVALTSVDAFYFNTRIAARGSVAGEEGVDGKFTSLDFAVHDGRVQDILRLFMREDRPPMSGITNFQAHVTVPPEGRPFLKEVTLQGEFDIGDGRFEHPSRQQSVNELSQTARGLKTSKEKNEVSAEVVTSHVHGQASVRDGVATFTDLGFVIPGANASMHGTFNLLSEKIGLHGTLSMESKFSQSTSGIKSFFAKVLDPFMNKKRGSVVPVLVDGSYSQPHFGLDLNPIKK